MRELVNTHTAININQLESVQRRAIRFVMPNYDRYSSQ